MRRCMCIEKRQQLVLRRLPWPRPQDKPERPTPIHPEEFESRSRTHVAVMLKAYAKWLTVRTQGRSQDQHRNGISQLISSGETACWQTFTSAPPANASTPGPARRGLRTSASRSARRTAWDRRRGAVREERDPARRGPCRRSALAYSRATRSPDTGPPNSAIIFAAGPLMARPATIGETARIGTDARSSRSRMPSMASIGPILT